MRKTVGFAAIIALLGSLITGSLARADAPSNDNRSAATRVTALPFTDTLSTDAATGEPGEPQPCNVGATVWYRYEATESGQLEVDTQGSDFDTVVAVYTDDGAGGIDLVHCNDHRDDSPWDDTSHLVFAATAGTVYWVQVGGSAGATGGLALLLDEVKPDGYVTGDVTDETTGEPLADVCVAAVDADGNYEGYGYTDGDGRYELAVAPGEYRVTFEWCGYDRNFASEWWDDKPTFEEADPVVVVSNESIAGIDAALTPTQLPPPYSPADLGIDGVTVERPTVRTDDLDTGLHTGASRIVHVPITNNGPGRGFARAYLTACTASDGSCDLLGGRAVELTEGATLDWQVGWNTTGIVGDVHLEAWIENCDGNSSNNAAEADDYSVVGGTGSGYDLRRIGVYPYERSANSRSVVISSHCGYAVPIGPPPVEGGAA